MALGRRRRSSQLSEAARAPLADLRPPARLCRSLPGAPTLKLANPSLPSDPAKKIRDLTRRHHALRQVVESSRSG